LGGEQDRFPRWQDATLQNQRADISCKRVREQEKETCGQDMTHEEIKFSDFFGILCLNMFEETDRKGGGAVKIGAPLQESTFQIYLSYG